jgi:micrococcal nuclease
MLSYSMRWAFFIVLVLAGPAIAGDRFTLCSEGWLPDCVVDGDTIHMGGQSIRLIDIDAPEISKPNCPAEYELGQKAKLRLLELLNASPVEVKAISHRDHDVYGRKLRLVLVDGTSAGALLINEGLASRWQGRHHRWCE